MKFHFSFLVNKVIVGVILGLCCVVTSGYGSVVESEEQVALRRAVARGSETEIKEVIVEKDWVNKVFYDGGLAYSSLEWIGTQLKRRRNLQEKIIVFLLDHGALPLPQIRLLNNFFDMIGARGGEKSFALLRAALERGKFRISLISCLNALLPQLLGHGVTISSKFGLFPLSDFVKMHDAEKYGNLSRMINNLRGPDYRTFLHEAVRILDISMIRKLLEHGSAVDALDNKGRSAAYYLVRSLFEIKTIYPQKLFTIAKILMDKGLSIEKEDLSGQSVIAYCNELIGYLEKHRKTGFNFSRLEARERFAIDFAVRDKWSERLAALKKLALFFSFKSTFAGGAVTPLPSDVFVPPWQQQIVRYPIQLPVERFSITQPGRFQRRR